MPESHFGYKQTLQSLCTLSGNITLLIKNYPCYNKEQKLTFTINECQLAERKIKIQ